MTKGIPDGWEQEKVGQISFGEYWVNNFGQPQRWDSDHPSISKNYVIIRKIEKPKQYRPFANAAEYFANRREGSAVDGKNNTIAPGFFAVVSVNQPYCWVAFGTKIVRFDWAEAFENLQFRHHDNSTSPFGIEVKE